MRAVFQSLPGSRHARNSAAISIPERMRFVLSLLMMVGLVLHYGWHDPLLSSEAAHWIQFAFLALYIATVIPVLRRETTGSDLLGFIRALAKPERLIVLTAAALSWWWLALGIAGGALLIFNTWRIYLRVLQKNINPSLIFVGSFAAIVAIGAVGLKLPASTPVDQPLSWTDAAFTATSAACVTGLTLRDTGTGFTRFGQWIILGLVQLGGLGVILFGSLVALLLGSSLGLRATSVLADSTNPGMASPAKIRRLVLFAAAVVFVCELVGAATLYLGWPSQDQWSGAPVNIDGVGDRIFASLFHSISAFCNAGFATSADSLRSVQMHWTSHVVIGGLIVIGGLGLPVYANLAQIARHRFKVRRGKRARSPNFSLHTRIVLWSTLALYVVGVLGLSLGAIIDRGQSISTALLNAHFMSISARTAGFETITPTSIDPLGQLTLMAMMFIGGSPGSAAGGVKTVAIVVLVLVAFRAAQGRESTTVFKRKIPEEMLRKAASLFLLHIIVIGVTLATLLVTESRVGGVGREAGGFERLLFESISACSTVGLTLDTTGRLSDAGKWALIAGMFLGRVGSLAFLVALVGLAGKRRPRYDYATEGVTLS